jgi:pimeloyl-ACP methyl ester carboxylesterase
MSADAVPGQRLRLADGRTLGFRIYGDPGGAPVLFLHGTPASSAQFSIAHETAGRLRLALVAPDRWGYGQTGAPLAPSLRGFAGDMAALMDSLGAGRFAVGGVSGGGPYAAAVAAGLAPRVDALALIGPVGPIADAGLSASLPLLHRLRFTVLPNRPRTVSAAMRAFRWSAAHVPRLAGRLMTWSSAHTDRRLMRQAKVARPILGSVREGLRPGTVGPTIDLAIFSRPWGIDLSAIAAPARVWIGTADSIVPLPAVRALARRIPHCELTELPGAGHLWVAVHHAEVLGWIAAAIHAPAGAVRTV